MIRLFAMALDLPETYFDAITNRPGAGSVMIHYPGTPEADLTSAVNIGIGSHTDIHCKTLLWQDNLGGLQVLSASNEWLDASSIESTLVVNIEDFLQRLSNKKFESTVHRVCNRTNKSRYTTPFFLVFNPNAKYKVVETCVDRGHLSLYEPISCGEMSRVFPEHVMYTYGSTELTYSSGIGSASTWRKRHRFPIHREWHLGIDLSLSGLVSQYTENEMQKVPNRQTTTFHRLPSIYSSAHPA
jgi:hypothetical protein